MSKNTLKVEKEMPEFVAEVAGLSVQELDARLATLAKNNEAVEQSKEADEDLASAKEAVKQFNAPYREAKAAIRSKTSYIVALIEEKGGK